jgi:hypothetical protein
VDPWADPDWEDPSAELSQKQLAAVNTQSQRVSEQLDGWSCAAISRQLADVVVDGTDLTSAVVRMVEALETAPGRVVPIGKLDLVDRKGGALRGVSQSCGNLPTPVLLKSG